MKLNKFFMLGMAGLAFAACSNEEENVTGNATFEGNGVVSVRIAMPTLTRAAGEATTGADGSTVAVTGNITVTLTGIDGNGSTYNESITIDASTLEPQTELKFWNIATPQKLTASINGGVADYTQTEITATNLQVAAASIPAYGETSSFTLTSESDSPVLTNDGKTEAGAESGDEDKDYQMYEATVTMAIPVARLELGGIYHIDHTAAETECIYSKLSLDGAYLDTYCLNGSKYENGVYPNSISTAGDYSFDGTHGTGSQSGLRDKIDCDDFLSITKDNALGTYTYNFFANGTNPVLKLYFAQATGTETSPVSEPRYAMVTKYQQLVDGEMQDVTFENGHIYRITKAELDDDNIIGDEGGNTLYGVVVTVTEATWTIVDITADWAE